MSSTPPTNAFIPSMNSLSHQIVPLKLLVVIKLKIFKWHVLVGGTGWCGITLIMLMNWGLCLDLSCKIPSWFEFVGIVLQLIASYWMLYSLWTVWSSSQFFIFFCRADMLWCMIFIQQMRLGNGLIWKR